MTGVGAVFELYQSFAESKKKKDDDEEEKEDEEESQIEGHIDEESDWHYVIAREDWDTCLDMLQNYDFHKYKEVRPRKGPPDKRLRALGALIWVKEKIIPKKIPEIPKSPLLALNENGETPLHAAVRHLMPDKYVLRLIFSERRATQVIDNEQQLALHLACKYNRNIPVVDRLIRANFKHMQQVNSQGQTPLMVAIQNAISLQEEDGGNKEKANSSYWNLWGYWGIPRSRLEAEWQERQEHIWSKVRFILLSYSTRRKILIDEERSCLLDSLEHAAPPTVIEVTVLAAQGMLHRDPTLAATALGIFMRREYPIKNLQLMLHHFPEKNFESMEGARKILSDHYRIGCRVLPGKTMTYREEMEKHALEDNFKRSLMCQEWWDKVRCLLRLRGHANNKEDKKAFKNEYLLHAALTNSDTAPSLVQLLMVMNPESIKLPHPFNRSLLIHIVCKCWKYNLYPQSKKVGFEIEEMEEPPMEQVLKIIVTSDPTLVRKRMWEDRLPIHHAIITGKSVDFLDGLVKVDRQLLSVRDPEYKLYPFQLAALGNVNKNAGNWAAAKYTKEEWKDLSIDDRATAVDIVRNEQDCDQLSTIYYLLRNFPQAISSGAELPKPASFRDTKGKGMVSTHCLMLIYTRDVDIVNVKKDKDKDDDDDEEEEEKEKEEDEDDNSEEDDKEGDKKKKAKKGKAKKDDDDDTKDDDEDDKGKDDDKDDDTKDDKDDDTKTSAAGGTNQNNKFVFQKDKLALLQQTIANKEVPEELETWFSKLKFWIRYCYDGDDELPFDDNYLLHAAVSNEDTPPMIVELLLAIFPHSAALPVNDSETVFPLHLAAATPCYKRQPFEVHDEGKNIFELLVQANPDAATIKSSQGLPVDIAQAAGHYSEEEIEPLLQGAMRQYVMDMDLGGNNNNNNDDDEEFFGGDAGTPGLEGLGSDEEDECSELTEPPLE